MAAHQHVVSASLEFVVDLDDSAGNVAVPQVSEQFVELWVEAADPTATSGKIRSSPRVTRISSPIADIPGDRCD